MASGKHGLFVVVWECQNYQGRWRPYSPEVTQHLERAYSKNLRSVKLGDANPDLNGLTVVLSEMKEICSDQDQNNFRSVRRHFYPQNSPAGQGAVWQWSGENIGDWFTYDMCVQIVLEDAWTTGTQTVDLSVHFPGCPYSVDFCNLTQTNKSSGYVRSVRRANQAGYPITRPKTPLQSNNFGHRSSSSSSSSPNEHCPRLPEGAFTTEGEAFRRRSSKEDLETKSKIEGGARSLLNKVGGLLHRGSNNSNDIGNASKAMSSNQNKVPSMNTSNKHYSSTVTGVTDRIASTKTSSKASLFHGNNSSLLIRPPETTYRGKKKPPVPKPRTRFPVQDELLPNEIVPQQLGQHSRVDSVEEQFGSNGTLNSDSSTVSARRPSIETISTYLSQESFIEDFGAQSLPSSHYQASTSRVDNLIRLDDSVEEDDVFAVDREVRDVFMKSVTNSPSNDRNSPSERDSHFVPISDASMDYNNLEEQLHGVKRKKTSDKGSKSAPNASPYATNNNRFSNFKMRKPQNTNEMLLVNHTQKVLHPPNSDCSICMCSFSEAPGFDSNAGYLVSPVVATSKCKHIFHEQCLEQLLLHAVKTNIFLQCPNCNTIHGEKWGTQPKGSMDVRTVNSSLPGYTKCRTFQITYNFPPGIQGPEHPHPGRSYHPVGFPRIAYLPDNEKGRKVLKLLKVSFDRRLTFTVGTSVTSGMSDCVTWNEIHHKTSWHNQSGHGYPDLLYLDNVLDELKSHGIVE